MSKNPLEVVRIRSSSDHGFVISDNPHLDDPKIAVVHGRHDDTDEQVLRLAQTFAAAPEMLEALKRAQTLLQLAPGKEAAAVVDAAEAAIAKAEGRSS